MCHLAAQFDCLESKTLTINWKSAGFKNGYQESFTIEGFVGVQNFSDW